MYRFCPSCGASLLLKKVDGEYKKVPFCSSCNEFHFPHFNIAISTVIFNSAKNRILLLRQKGRSRYTLLAGYANKGESLEQTLIREVKEEVGLNVQAFRFMRSCYYEKSNTLMCNFLSLVDKEDLSDYNRHEVDHARWFDIDDAKEHILEHSLAELFLEKILREKTYLEKLEEVSEVRNYPQAMPLSNNQTSK